MLAYAHKNAEATHEYMHNYFGFTGNLRREAALHPGFPFVVSKQANETAGQSMKGIVKNAVNKVTGFFGSSDRVMVFTGRYEPIPGSGQLNQPTTGESMVSAFKSDYLTPFLCFLAWRKINEKNWRIALARSVWKLIGQQAPSSTVQTGSLE